MPSQQRRLPADMCCFASCPASLHHKEQRLAHSTLPTCSTEIRLGWPYWLDGCVRKAPRSMAVSSGPRLQNSLTSHTSVAACCGSRCGREGAGVSKGRQFGLRATRDCCLWGLRLGRAAATEGEASWRKGEGHRKLLLNSGAYQAPQVDGASAYLLPNETQTATPSPDLGGCAWWPHCARARVRASGEAVLSLISLHGKRGRGVLLAGFHLATNSTAARQKQICCSTTCASLAHAALLPT